MPTQSHKVLLPVLVTIILEHYKTVNQMIAHITLQTQISVELMMTQILLLVHFAAHAVVELFPIPMCRPRA